MMEHRVGEQWPPPTTWLLFLTLNNKVITGHLRLSNQLSENVAMGCDKQRNEKLSWHSSHYKISYSNE